MSKPVASSPLSWRFPFLMEYKVRVLTWYNQFSQWASRSSGRPVAFILVSAMVLLWAMTGPIFDFSDTWQLVMNTVSSIVTFLMVFVIQNTQNRQGDAIQIKLDELIRATQGAHNALLDLEELEQEQLEEFRRRYVGLALRARGEMRKGNEQADTDTREP